MGKSKLAAGFIEVLQRAFNSSKGAVKQGFEKGSTEHALNIAAREALDADMAITAEKALLNQRGQMEMFKSEFKRLTDIGARSSEFESLIGSRTKSQLDGFNQTLTEHLESGSFNTAKDLAKRVIKDEKKVEELFLKRDYKGVRREAHTSMYNEQLALDTQVRADELRTWIGDDEVNKILTNSTSPEDYAQKLYTAQITGDKLLVESGSFSQRQLNDKILDAFSDLNSTIGSTYEKLMTQGRVMSAKVLERMHYLNENVDTMRGKLGDLFENGALELKKMGDVKSRLARDYIENIRLDPQYFKNGGHPYGKAVKADWDLVSQLNSSVKNASDQLNPEDIRNINKIINSYRTAKQVETRWTKNKVYDHSDVPLWGNINGDDLMHVNSFGAGDVGVNYFHTVGTKEYLQKLQSHRPDLYSQSGIKDADEYKKAFFYQKMRRENSALRMNAENRLAPHEELQHYYHSYNGAMIKGEYKRLKNELHRSLLLDVKKEGNPFQDIIAPLDRHIDAKLAKRDFKSWSEMGMMEKAVHSFIQTNVAFALVSPRMWFFNHAQGLTTSSTQKGFVNNLTSILQHDAMLGKEFIKNPKGFIAATRDPRKLNEIFHNMANNRTDPFTKSLFDRYVSNHSEFYRANLPFDISEAGAKLRKITDVITLPFQASDKIARFAMFESGLRHGKGAYEKFAKNVEKGMDRREALKGLWKEAHLGEFDYISQKRIIDSINFKDIKNNKEFLYQYSSRSVKVEAFDYGKAGAPFLKDWANAQHPLVATAFTFQTWNMYYSQLIRGAVRSYKNGDPKPLGMLAFLGATWYMGAQMAASSDNDFIADYGRYAAGRTPAFMPTIGLAELAFKEPAGVLTPVIRGGEFPLLAGFEYVNRKMFPGAKKNSVDYMYDDALKDLQNTIGVKRAQGLYESMEGLVNYIRENNLNNF